VLSTFAGGTCPASVGTCTQQVGAARSKGAQVDLTMTPLDHWQMAAGYAFVDALVTRSTISQQIGAQLPNSPMNSAHLWTRYDLTEGTLAGLGAGLGVSFIGNRQSLLPTATSTVTLPLPSYTVTDLGLYYALGNADVTFRVSNLFDKSYFITAGSLGAVNLMPGNPRTLELTVRTTF
jgi:iron complex outermembrane receptor protein